MEYLSPDLVRGFALNVPNFHNLPNLQQLQNQLQHLQQFINPLNNVDANNNDEINDAANNQIQETIDILQMLHDASALFNQSDGKFGQSQVTILNIYSIISVF